MHSVFNCSKYTIWPIILRTQSYVYSVSREHTGRPPVKPVFLRKAGIFPFETEYR